MDRSEQYQRDPDAAVRGGQSLYEAARKKIRAAMVPLVEAAAAMAKAEAELTIAKMLDRLTTKADLQPGDVEAFKRSCRREIIQQFGGRVERGRFSAAPEFTPQELVEAECFDHEREHIRQMA